MGATDRRTAEAGISLGTLMENAGQAVATFITRHYPEAAHVLVLCGKGNNGGDGFVVARVLAGEGVGVRVLLAGRQEDVKGEAAEALGALKQATSEDVVGELGEQIDMDELAELLGEADLLVDAVVGTGFKPPLRGAAAAVRDALEKTKVPVVCRRFAQRLGRRLASRNHRGLLPRRRRRYVYRAEVRACLRTFDRRCLRPSSRGRHRLARERYRERRRTHLDRRVQDAHREAAPDQLQQGQVRACAGRRWKLRYVRRAEHGFARLRCVPGPAW